MSECILYCCTVHGCIYPQGHFHDGVRCPAGDALIHERDKNFAINTIKNSMETHQAWLDHFDVCEFEECEEWAKDTVGDREHQKQVLREYKRVLDYLEST